MTYFTSTRASARICFFFFSSRRRHTRFDCDWSSDVCSSDLAGIAPNGHAALWDHGVITDLGTLGGSFSRPFALNDAGRVVGWSGTATGEYHAFVWADGVMTDIGTLGGTLSQAVSVNAAGQVVGASRTATAGQQHAFLRQNRVLSHLGTVGG